MELAITVGLISAFIIIFVYVIGRMQGSQSEKGKSDNERHNALRRASSARTNSDIVELRRVFKRR